MAGAKERVGRSKDLQPRQGGSEDPQPRTRQPRPRVASSGAKAPALQSVTITHPEKVLFPDDGITKAELAAYYDAVADVMLPHLRNRPITMERFPAGIGSKGFLQ